MNLLHLEDIEKFRIVCRKCSKYIDVMFSQYIFIKTNECFTVFLIYSIFYCFYCLKRRKNSKIHRVQSESRT